MSDNLKKHIDNFPNEFDVYPFDVEAGWEDIKGRIEQPVIKHWKTYVVAACISVIMMTGFVYLNLDGTPKEEEGELAETEFYYQGIIDAKLSLVKSQVNDPMLLMDLEALDEAFAELQEDLQDGAQNEQIVIAMIENYRLKLSILERILEDLEVESDEEDIRL